MSTMNYLTGEEKERLDRQLKVLHSRRKVISDRIGRAREMGDLKENAEYHAAKEDQGLNELKIRELERKLSAAVVMDEECRNVVPLLEVKTQNHLAACCKDPMPAGGA